MAAGKENRQGWTVVAAAFALTFLGFGCAYSFAAFFKAFETQFAASRGDVSLAFSAGALVWFIVGAPGGMLADRFGARRVAAAGVLCLAAALWLASQAVSLDVLCAAYSVGIGLGVGLTYVPSVAAVQPWFDRNRVTASGLAVAGIGAGNLAMPAFAAWSIATVGWRAAYGLLAAIVLLIGLPAALALRRPPDALQRSGAASGSALRTTLRTTLRDGRFRVLYASVFLTGIGAFIPMVHLAPYARDLGYGEASAVALISFIGLGSLAGRFAIGPFADRWGARKSLAAVTLALGLLLLLWSLAVSYRALAMLAIAFGACYGAWVAVLPTIVTELYGARALGSTIGLLYTGAGFGTLLGPWLTGVAYDSLGSYRVPIFASAAFGLLAAACAAHLWPKPTLALDAGEAPPRLQPSNYPQLFASRMAGREKRPLGDLFGLSGFGVNLTRLAPGARSALRHAHSKQDEFIYVLRGRPVLVTDEGRAQLHPGMCAGFRAGSGNAHHLVNETSQDVLYLEIGDRRRGDEVTYPDDDLQAVRVSGKWQFAHKNGAPYSQDEGRQA